MLYAPSAVCAPIAVCRVRGIDARGKEASGADVFIVDNSDDDWKVLDYLKDWTNLSTSFDIATGYFEIGALLALDGQLILVSGGMQALYATRQGWRTGCSFIIWCY